LVNGLYQKLREISVYSPSFANIASDIIKIQKEVEVNLHHRDLVNKVRQEVSEKRSFINNRSNKFTDTNMSMTKKLEIINNDSISSSQSSPKSSSSNSNYDFELEAHEAKGMGKK